VGYQLIRRLLAKYYSMVGRHRFVLYRIDTQYSIHNNWLCKNIYNYRSIDYMNRHNSYMSNQHIRHDYSSRHPTHFLEPCRLHRLLCVRLYHYKLVLYLVLVGQQLNKNMFDLE
jgi:hypothetical protein